MTLPKETRNRVTMARVLREHNKQWLSNHDLALLTGFKIKESSRVVNQLVRMGFARRHYLLGDGRFIQYRRVDPAWKLMTCSQCGHLWRAADHQILCTICGYTPAVQWIAIGRVAPPVTVDVPMMEALCDPPTVGMELWDDRDEGR